MTDAKQSMFSDRRKLTDRRSQNLSMPAGLDRRVSNRRNKDFQSQAWWLQIDYASELVSEKLTGDFYIKEEKPTGSSISKKTE